MTTRIFFDQLDLFYDYWDMASYAKAGEFYTDRWTVINSRSVEVGDQIYFLDSFTSAKKMGFFARGKVVKADKEEQLRYQDEAYKDLSPAYCTDPWELQENEEQEILHVSFKLDSAIDGTKYNPDSTSKNQSVTLNLSFLKKQEEFKGLRYKPKNTGEIFPEKYVKALDHYWEEHVKKLAKEDIAVLLPAFRRRKK
jgi:hypothetical protein